MSRARLLYLQNELVENSMKSLTDELQDVRAERDVFQQKAHRLNVEMNHIVGNDEIRILDIDALCMENRSVSPPEKTERRSPGAALRLDSESAKRC